MRNLRYLLGASGLVMIMVGCSPKAPQAVPAPVAPVAVAAPAPPVNVPPAAFKPVRPTAGYRPEWIDNQKSVPGIAGVGQRKRNAMGDVMLQRKLALAQARIDVAGQISVLAQNHLAMDTASSGTANDDGTSATSSEAMTNAANDTIRNLVNQTLVGVTPQEYWTDPEDRSIWCLVVLDPASAERSAKVAEAGAIRKEVAMGAKGLKDGLDRLDNEIAKQAN